ncbi:MAG TPA: hypothetical protein VFB38_16995 [Chthonomonadaceae bacterium]|nr:hypothetical protein [Chthonomonadaceae bacterium]
MEIALTENERQILVELLEDEFQSLRSEVYRADSHEAKEVLKAREATVRKLLERLQPPAQSGAS